MLDSIRVRLTLSHVAALALLLVTFCLLVYAMLFREHLARVDSVAESFLDATGVILGKELNEPGLIDDGPKDTLKAISFTNAALTIYDFNRRLVVEKPADAGRLTPLSANAREVDRVPYSYTVSASSDGHAEQRRVAAIRISYPSVNRTYWIVASQSLEPMFAEMAEIRRVFYIAVPLALLAAGFGGYYLARKTMAPVMAISEQARRIGATSLEERLNAVNPRDELGHLTGTLNELLDRISTAFTQQRQFMADASHELRTPVSVIRTASDVTLSQKHRTEEEYRNVLKIIDEQSRSLGRIVEDMFRLARADSGSLRPQVTDFHLDELLLDAARDARILAAAKGVEVVVKEFPEAPFHGDHDLIGQMIMNLLENAVKYTPRGGRIKVGLDHSGEEYAVQISDSGVGIPQPMQAHIFERFYRADHSRSRENGEGSSGAGLGLAIARWIAEAHHGHLELRHSDEKGSTFIATLPAPVAAEFIGNSSSI
jgi:heavy metal sensor kinase